jgi:hypothetical protein
MHPHQMRYGKMGVANVAWGEVDLEGYLLQSQG